MRPAVSSASRTLRCRALCGFIVQACRGTASANNGYAETHFFSVPTADTDIITIPVAYLSNHILQVQATSTNPNATLSAFWGSGGGGTKLGQLTNNGNGNFSGQFQVNADDGVVTIMSLTHGCSEASVNRSTGWHCC